jgi:hypothetical protein
VCKMASLELAIPWLDLKGISTGEMQSAPEALLGPVAIGLSARRCLASNTSGGPSRKPGATAEWMTTSGSISGEMRFIMAFGPSRSGGVPKCSSAGTCKEEAFLGECKWDSRSDAELARSAVEAEGLRAASSGAGYWRGGHGGFGPRWKESMRRRSPNVIGVIRVARC